MTPITLHAHEIRRLLDHGSALLVRPVKPQPDNEWMEFAIRSFGADNAMPIAGNTECRRPAEPGSLAWGRETWRRTMPDLPNGLEYRADGLLRWFDGSDDAAALASVTYPRDGRWRSPVTMPAWASRFPRLRVADVRCVRVGELADSDAFSAGFEGEHPGYARIHMQTDWYDRHHKARWTDDVWKAWAWAVELSIKEEE